MVPYDPVKKQYGGRYICKAGVPSNAESCAPSVVAAVLTSGVNFMKLFWPKFWIKPYLVKI
jgi:hypothetical protein